MMQKRFNQDLLFFIIVGVLALLGTGYGVMHLPEVYAERDKTFDLKRVSDLGELNSEIAYYKDQYGMLPKKLEEVQESQINYYGFPDESTTTLPLNDPQTGAPYAYGATSETTYQLCATFATDTKIQMKPIPSESNQFYGDSPDFGFHPKGYYCFMVESYEDPYAWEEEDPYKDLKPTPAFVCLGEGCPTIMPRNETNDTDYSTQTETAPAYQQ